MMSKQTRNERDDLQLEANRGHHGMLNTTPELQVVMKGSKAQAVGPGCACFLP